MNVNSVPVSFRYKDNRTCGVLGEETVRTPNEPHTGFARRPMGFAALPQPAR